MPILKNPRMEKFAQACASGLSASDAYRAAYNYKGNKANSHASTLLSKIRHRVTELQQASATETTLTMQERRMILAGIARDVTCSPRARIAAVLADAKLCGNPVEREIPPDANDGRPILTRAMLEKIQEARRRAILWQQSKRAERADGSPEIPRDEFPPPSWNPPAQAGSAECGDAHDYELHRGGTG